MGDRYVSKVSISHGQERGEKKQEWNVKRGMVFDPAEMGMTKDTVDGLVSSKRVAVHEGGEGSMARPVRAAQVAPPAGSTQAGQTAPTGGSTQGGRTAPTGGSTQGGKAPGA